MIPTNLTAASCRYQDLVNNHDTKLEKSASNRLPVE
jgi:hypothetical protein